MCVYCYDVARESSNRKYSHGREKAEIYEVGQKEPWGADSEQFPSPFPSYTHTQTTNNNHSLCCLVAKSCLILCDPLDCSKPGFPVLCSLPAFVQIHVHWVGDAIQPSHPLSSPSPWSFPASGSFPISQLFTSGGQSIGASASASVLPMNIQGWFPLGLTGFISLYLF